MEELLRGRDIFSNFSDPLRRKETHFASLWNALNNVCSLLDVRKSILFAYIV